MNTPDHEMIVFPPLSDLHPFPDHPFQIRDDEAMRETADSIRQYGVLVPAIVRPLQDGTYEIISGHRRMRACVLAGLDTMPCIVRDVDQDTATIIMVDSNLQRENILPSERAKAYKMKLDAIKRQGARHDLTCAQVEHKLDTSPKSVTKIAEEAGTSRAQVQRYIRLTELQPELQRMVDEGRIALTPAVELSYLKPEEQNLLLDTLSSEQATLSLSQAQRMKRLSQEGKLTDDSMLSILSEQKKPEAWNISLPSAVSVSTFPRPTRPNAWRRPSSSCWITGCVNGKESKNDKSGFLRVYLTRIHLRNLLRIWI